MSNEYTALIESSDEHCPKTNYLTIKCEQVEDHDDNNDDSDDDDGNDHALGASSSAAVEVVDHLLSSFSECHANQRVPINLGLTTQSLKTICELEHNSDKHHRHIDPEFGAQISSPGKIVNTNITDEDVSTTLTRTEFWIIFALIYGNFWIAACVSLQAPFFPKEAELKGASPTQYGFVFGVYELMILITAPLFGKLVARRSPIGISKSGLLICGAATMAFGFIDRIPAYSDGGESWHFIGAAYAIRIVEGTAASAFMTSSYTLMAAKFPARVASTFAYLEAAFGVGLIVGPTLGGALYQIGGFVYPFLALGACLLAGCIIIHFLMGDDDDYRKKDDNENDDDDDYDYHHHHRHRSEDLTRKRSSSERAANETTPSMLRFISDRGIIFDVMAIVTSLAYLGFNSATLEPHLRRFDLSPFVTGLIFIINGSTYALATPVWGKLCERNIDPKLLITIGSTLCWIGIIFLGPLSFIQLEPSLPLVFLALIVSGLGIAAKMVCSFMDAMNDSIKRRGFKNDVGTYGLVSAMFFTSCSIGASVGPSIGGFLLDTLDYRRSTIIIFAVDVCMTLYGLFFVCHRGRSKQLRKLRAAINDGE